MDAPRSFEAAFTSERMNDVTPSGSAWALLIAAGESSSPFYYMGLAALIGVGVVAAKLAYSSWREAHEDLDPATPDELLDAFERARADGDLSAEELARLRDRIKKGG